MFTYIFGAGASVGVLPIVKEFPLRLIELKNKIFHLKLRENNHFGDTVNKADTKEKLLKDLEWLSRSASDHASVDTLAKKLYLSGNFKELNRLKSTLSTFLILEQLYNGVDKRYDAFLASILTKKENQIVFPENMFIISWNYDYQFELSLAPFISNADITKIENLMNIYPRKIEPETKGFKLIKLNGTAGGITDSHNKSFTRGVASFDKLDKLRGSDRPN